MSSRWMGTWPQLIGCALFKIGSLIPDGEFKSKRGYSTGRLEVCEISMENQEMVQGFPEHLRSKLGGLRQMSETESGEKVTSQYSDCRST